MAVSENQMRRAFGWVWKKREYFSWKAPKIPKGFIHEYGILGHNLAGSPSAMVSELKRLKLSWIYYSTEKLAFVWKDDSIYKEAGYRCWAKGDFAPALAEAAVACLSGKKPKRLSFDTVSPLAAVAHFQRNKK